MLHHAQALDSIIENVVWPLVAHFHLHHFPLKVHSIEPLELVERDLLGELRDNPGKFRRLVSTTLPKQFWWWLLGQEMKVECRIFSNLIFYCSFLTAGWLSVCGAWMYLNYNIIEKLCKFNNSSTLLRNVFSFIVNGILWTKFNDVGNMHFNSFSVQYVLPI